MILPKIFSIHCYIHRYEIHAAIKNSFVWLDRDYSETDKLSKVLFFETVMIVSEEV